MYIHSHLCCFYHLTDVVEFTVGVAMRRALRSAAERARVERWHFVLNLPLCCRLLLQLHAMRRSTARCRSALIHRCANRLLSVTPRALAAPLCRLAIEPRPAASSAFVAPHLIHGPLVVETAERDCERLSRREREAEVDRKVLVVEAAQLEAETKAERRNNNNRGDKSIEETSALRRRQHRGDDSTEETTA
jgi:hypothetical protein